MIAKNITQLITVTIGLLEIKCIPNITKNKGQRSNIADHIEKFMMFKLVNKKNIPKNTKNIPKTKFFLFTTFFLP